MSSAARCLHTCSSLCEEVCSVYQGAPQSMSCPTMIPLSSAIPSFVCAQNPPELPDWQPSRPPPTATQAPPSATPAPPPVCGRAPVEEPGVVAFAADTGSA